jgi:hypothetical protein
VLGHAEALLAAVRHLITNESCAAHFLPFTRFAETTIGEKE